MLKLCQAVGASRPLSNLYFVLQSRSLAASRKWAPSINEPTFRPPRTLDQTNIRDRTPFTSRRPQRAFVRPVKYGSDIKYRMDVEFAFSSMHELGAKYDAFVDGLLHTRDISDFTNFLRVSGKRSRNDLSSHMIRRLPDIALKLDSLASSEWRFMDISFVIYGLQSCKESDDGYLSILSTMSKIATRAVTQREIISCQNLSMIMYGLKNNKFQQKESREMLSCLHTIVERCLQTLSAQAVGNILYALQGMSSDDADVQLLLRALSPQLALCEERLGAQEVGNALYGLQGMSSDDADVRLLLRALSPLVQKCKEPLDAQAVGNALYGLKCMSSDDADVRLLLRALLIHIEWCTEPLGAQAVGNALYGLQGMSSKDSDVRSLLRALSPHVQNCKEPLGPQEVGNALYGLQGMSSKDSDVRSLLRALLPHVQWCKRPLGAQEVGNALYGLQGMRGEDSGVRLLLQALSPHVQRCTEPLSEQAVGNALYGLQGMRGDNPDLQLLLRALSPQVQRCKEPLSVQAVGNALYGLLDLLDSDIGRHLGLYMMRKFLGFHQMGRSITPEYIPTAQIVIMTLPLLRNLMTANEISECEQIISNVEDMVRSSSQGETSRINFSGSGSDKGLLNAAMKAFKMSNVRVSQSDHLFGLFRCDMLIQIPRVAEMGRADAIDSSLKIDIELDGLQRKRDKAKRYVRLRDRHLRYRGVVVERMDGSKLEAMSEQEMTEWVLHITARAILQQHTPSEST